MKKLYLFIGLILAVFFFTSCEKDQIQEPELKMELKTTNLKLNGFDDWGFNWNAQHFSGYLINAILADHMFQDFPHYKYPPYQGEGITYWNDLLSNFDYLEYFMPVELLDCYLIMHWNDGLISKEGVYPDTWIDSNGWITFLYTYNKDGEKWSHFRKMVASISTDYTEDGIWYNEDGIEIGIASIDWPTLIITQVANTGNVPNLFYHNETYNSPYGSGLGKYKLNNY